MSNTVARLSTSIADVVEEASGSVVRVEGRRRLAASGIVWDAAGTVVTANHVVKRDDDIWIALSSDERLQAEVVGRDPTTDLAVLKVESNLNNVARWIEEDDIRVGHIVLALGRPGTGVQAALGVVSALGQSWRTPAGGEISRYVQSDVVMYPGFSGGALVSANGEFIGLNTSGLVRGISVAVPGSSLAMIANELIEHGAVRRGYLGISLQIVRLPENLRNELDQRTGLLVAGIEPGSPASKSDLFLGDILVAAGGAPLRDMDDLFVQLTRDLIGNQLPFKIIRAGKVLDVEVGIGARKSG